MPLLYADIFEGSTLTAFVDGQSVLHAIDTLYPRGMAGLMAGGGKKALSRPYFDNLLINAVDAPVPTPTSALSGPAPIYGGTSSPATK